MLEKKVFIKDMENIENMMRCLPTVPDIQKWKKAMNDDKLKFQMEQEEFRKQFEVQNEIIAQYDVVLNEKVSKHALREIEKKLGDADTTQRVQTSSEIKRLEKEMQSNNEATATFIDQIDDMIVKIYDREQQIEKVKQDGENGDILSGENGKRIKKLLSMKADKIDLETIYQIKSNKKDTEGLLGT
jgi:hypothetical protein